MANDFTNDPNCVALWNFESGAVTADSIGTNTLTDGGVAIETTSPLLGTGSLKLSASDSKFIGIADADLSADFPLKSTGSGTFSVCARYKHTATGAGAGPRYLLAKYNAAAGERSFFMGTDGSCYPYCVIGYASGASYDISSKITSALTVGNEYHLAFTYNTADGGYRFKVYDVTAAALLGETTGTVTGLHLTTEKLWFGRRTETVYTPDGLLDEVVFFDDVLTSTEIDEVRAGTYSVAGTSTSVSFSGTVSNQTGSVGNAFSLDLSSFFSGTETPFTYAVTTGTLPAGLSIDANTGVISGTPTTEETQNGIVVTATDQDAATASTNSFQIAIAAAAHKGISITLYDGASPQASIAGITALWWDSASPSGAPAYETTTASTDASGVLTLDLDATTTLSVGQTGCLLLYKNQTPTEDSLVFFSQLAIEEV